MFPLNLLHMPVRVGRDTSLPGSCDGTSFTRYGRSALGAPSAFPQAGYPGIEAPSKDARNTGPTFVHPKVFHRISLDLDSQWNLGSRPRGHPGNLHQKTPSFPFRLSKRAEVQVSWRSHSTCLLHICFSGNFPRFTLFPETNQNRTF